MENVTFVSNSHQRPAADNLQKLKSLLTNTQQQIKSQTQQITIKNLYVSSFTLVCFRSGKLTISNNHDSTSYFIQCFKKYFKTTPSTFIKMANH